MNTHRLLNLFTIFFLLLIGSSAVVAQSDQDSVHRKANRILILPSHLFDPLNPSIQIGFERKIAKHSAIQLQYGWVLTRDLFNQFLNSLSVNVGATSPEKAGFKLRLEYRYYFGEPDERVFPYLAGECQYLDITTSTVGTFVASDENFPYDFEVLYEFTPYEDEFRYRKSRLGLNAKLGVLFLISSRITLDLYIGAGINFRNSVHFDRLNPNDWFFVPGFNHHWSPGRTFYPNVPAGFSLGVQF